MMMAAHNPPDHIVFHGGDMETLLAEWELGPRAAFDLFHLDETMFGPHPLLGEELPHRSAPPVH